MDDFDIMFGMPRHGWLPVNLSISNKNYEFSASYILGDPVSDLTDAVFGLLKGDSSATVRFWLEPEWNILALVRSNHSTATVTFTSLADDDGQSPNTPISTTIDTIEFCRLVAWRLRDMYHRVGGDRYESAKCAGRTFPYSTISSIHDLLGD